MWDLIMGQEETVSQLKKAVDTAEISHAYLFCGPLGVGKRLTAKVFASVFKFKEYEYFVLDSGEKDFIEVKY